MTRKQAQEQRAEIAKVRQALAAMLGTNRFKDHVQYTVERMGLVKPASKTKGGR